MTIRIGRGTLSFSMPNDEENIVFEPYVVKSGISMAANLREAFKTSDFLRQLPDKARVLIDSDVLLVPVNLFDEHDMTDLYAHSFPDHAHDSLFYNVLTNLNVVAVSSINKDLKLVITDHFSDVRFITSSSPVWHHLYQRSFTGNSQKLFGYIHERRLDIFCFQVNRFKFCNTYDIRHIKDAIYYLLYVWNQLQMNATTDELHLVGDLFQLESATIQHERDILTDELHRFLQKVYIINPSADFNRAQVTTIKNMPYDLQTLFVKGR